MLQEIVHFRKGRGGWGGIYRNDHKKRSIRKIWKLLKFKRICLNVLPEGTTVYLPNEIELSNWSPDTQSFSNVSNNLLGVAICNFTWFTDQSPVLQITSSDFLKEKKNVKKPLTYAKYSTEIKYEGQTLLLMRSQNCTLSFASRK